MTRREFAVDQVPEGRDVVHKSPEFAALMMHLVLAGDLSQTLAGDGPRKKR